MTKSIILTLTLAATLGFASHARAGPVEDATAAVTAWLDKFNAGDMDGFFAGHRDGAIIIDEFAPYVWGGTGSAQRWASDYAKDSEARGISGGRLDYGKPVQAGSDGKSAYVVVPTTYKFIQKRTKMAAPGSMTFVLGRSGGAWKISSWTYSGATPAPERSGRRAPMTWPMRSVP